MQKKAPKAPPAPDPVATAQAQSNMNRETAITQFGLNAVNQTTPYGQLYYGQIGTWEDGTPRYHAVQTLAPEEQRALDQSRQGQDIYGQIALQQLGAVRDRLSAPVSFGDAPQIRDGAEARARVEQALFDRIKPQLDRDRLSLENRLRNQGLSPGGEAWGEAMRDANMAENDARLAIIAAGGNEQQRDFGQSMASRQQGIQEILSQRSVPLNEAAALLSGEQVQAPTFVNVPQTNVAPTDYMQAVGLQQAGMNNAFNARNQMNQAQLSGLYGLGSAALGGWASGGLGLLGGLGMLAGRGGVKRG